MTSKNPSIFGTLKILQKCVWYLKKSFHTESSKILNSSCLPFFHFHCSNIHSWISPKWTLNFRFQLKRNHALKKPLSSSFSLANCVHFAVNLKKSQSFHLNLSLTFTHKSECFHHLFSRKKPRWNFNDSLVCPVDAAAVHRQLSSHFTSLCIVFKAFLFLIKTEAITQEPCLITDARKMRNEICINWINDHKIDEIKAPKSTMHGSGGFVSHCVVFSFGSGFSAE